MSQVENTTKPQLYLNLLKSIPIARIDAATQKPFVQLVNRILAAKRANPTADISKWEMEIDHLVYKLYGLTPDDIAIVEGK